jgi:hypothetical protein
MRCWKKNGYRRGEPQRLTLMRPSVVKGTGLRRRKDVRFSRNSLSKGNVALTSFPIGVLGETPRPAQFVTQRNVIKQELPSELPRDLILVPITKCESRSRLIAYMKKCSGGANRNARKAAIQKRNQIAALTGLCV